MKRTLSLVGAAWCALALIGSARAETTASPRSNVRLVEDCVRKAATELVAQCPTKIADSAMGVWALSNHQANWMAEHVLAQALEARGFHTATGGEPPEDSTQAVLLQKIPPTPYRFEYRVAELAFSYPRVYRSGLFGGKMVERAASASLFGRVVDAHSGAVLWTGEGSGHDRDAVDSADLPVLSAQSVPVTTPPTVPASRGMSRIVEPVLVAAIIGSLVALFYSNR
jgi:hypothetical protein